MMSEDLDNLAGEAAAIDSQNAPMTFLSASQLQQQQQEQESNEAEEVGGLITIMTGLFSPLFPSLKDIYTPDTIKNIAEAAVPVMQKHGWSTGLIMGRYSEEFALAAVLLPVGLATYKGIKNDLLARSEKQELEPQQDNKKIEGIDEARCL